MTDQNRFNQLVSGGAIRITEAIMRGSGPVGPIGPEGPQGVATTILGRKDTYDPDIANLTPTQGAAWIADDTGRLWTANAETNRWVDAGPIVGPPGYLNSVGAELTHNPGTNLPVPNTGEAVPITWTTVEYNDTEEILTEELQNISTSIIALPAGDPPYDYFTFGNPKTTINVLNLNIQFNIEDTNSEGWVQAEIWSTDTNGQQLVGIAREYVGSNATQLDQTISLTRGWQSDITQTITVQVRASQTCTVEFATFNIVRTGGGTGPQGPKGAQGEQGIQGPQGLQGAPGVSTLPAGLIMMWSGVAGTIPSDWLLCDGSAIPGNYTDLINLVGNNTPDLRGRFIKGHATYQFGESNNESGPNQVQYRRGGTTGNMITNSHLPVHSHGGATGNESAFHNHVVGMSGAGGHFHKLWYLTRNEYAAGSNKWAAYHMGTGPDPSQQTDYINDHTHAAWSNNNTTTHTHTISSSGAASPLAFVPEYYEVVFIIKG